MDEAYRRRSEELMQLTIEDEQRLNDEAPFELDQTDGMSVAPTDPSSPTPLDPDQARRKRLSADLLDASLQDERMFEDMLEEQDDRHRLELAAEDFERGLDNHDD